MVALDKLLQQEVCSVSLKESQVARGCLERRRAKVTDKAWDKGLVRLKANSQREEDCLVQHPNSNPRIY